MGSDAIAILLAKQEIQDVVHRYCRGIDRMDRELVASCYHADATDEHGSFSGPVAAFLDWVFPLLETFDRTFHLIGNHAADVVGSVAVAETYGLAFHESSDPDPRRNLLVGFRYVDRFERSDGSWRIARRIATTEWTRVLDPALRWALSPTLRTGRRDRDDVWYEMVSEAIADH